ncbi:Oxidoreductase [Pseudomonas amygdali pv. morsprunorum]|nr:Oxidoreductase [Pseudomonas amygdali pv. morsprunorum]
MDSSAVQPSRRNFLKFGASGIAAATLSTWIPSDGMLQAAPAAPVIEDSDAPAAGEQRIQLKVNGQVHTLNVPANAVLLDVLRDRLQLTGTKKGCDHGQCGACTLLVNGVAINSCLSIAVQHHHHRRPGRERQAAPGTGSLLGARCLSMRLLHVWTDNERGRDSPGPEHPFR